MKKEVLVTSNLVLFNQVRDEFDRQGISNKTEVMNSGSSYRRGGFLGGRGDFPTGRVGERQDLQVSYYICEKGSNRIGEKGSCGCEISPISLKIDFYGSRK